MRSLFMAMTATTIPSDVVIAGLTWQSPYASTDRLHRCEVIPKGRKWVFRCVNEEGFLEALLLARNTGMQESRKPSVAHREPATLPEREPWHCFTTAEIEAYTTAVGDRNEIHKGEAAVVPGCLLLERLVATAKAQIIGDDEYVDTVAMRFLRPCYGNEVLYWHREVTSQRQDGVWQTKMMITLYDDSGLPLSTARLIIKKKEVE